MDDKILKAIAETLPETQVAMIKDALIERDKLREQVSSIQEESNQYKKWWHELGSENSKLKSQAAKNADIMTSLIEQNQVFMAKDVEARVVLAEGKLEAVNTTVDKFLKNTIYREAMQHQIADEYTSVDMQYVNGQPVPVPTPGKTHKQVTDNKERTTE